MVRPHRHWEMPLSPLDLPGHILDAHLLACLLVVIVPLTLGEIDAGECRSSLQSFGFPIALNSQMSLRSEYVTRNSWTLHFETALTSGLNSVNSRPRQSNSMIFCPLDLLSSVCWSAFGPAVMEAECVFYVHHVLSALH